MDASCQKESGQTLRKDWDKEKKVYRGYGQCHRQSGMEVTRFYMKVCLQIPFPTSTLLTPDVAAAVCVEWAKA